MSNIKTRIDALNHQRSELECRHRREIGRIDKRIEKVQAECKHPRPRGGLFGIVTCEDCRANLNRPKKVSIGNRKKKKKKK